MTESMPVCVESKSEKPVVLYHASQEDSVTLFTPRVGRVRDTQEGARVFATPHRGLATAFLIEGYDDDWVIISMVNDVPLVVIHADREEFIAHDRGGTLYEFPPDSFECDRNKGLREHEWTSADPVTPTQSTKIPSTLDAMVAEGVQVYFVTEEEFGEIRQAPTPYIFRNLVSENMRRGQQVIDIATRIEEDERDQASHAGSGIA